MLSRPPGRRHHAVGRARPREPRERADRVRAAAGHPDHRYVTTVETLAEDAGRSDFSRFEASHYWRDGVFRYESLDGPPPIRRTPGAPNEPFDVAIEKSSLVVDRVP